MACAFPVSRTVTVCPPSLETYARPACALGANATIAQPTKKPDVYLLPTLKAYAIWLQPARRTMRAASAVASKLRNSDRQVCQRCDTVTTPEAQWYSLVRRGSQCFQVERSMLRMS